MADLYHHRVVRNRRERSELDHSLRAIPASASPSLVALAATPEELERATEELRPALRVVGQHVDVLVRRREARDEQGLLLRVLADAPGAVAGAHAGVLPAAHGQLERDVVQLRVVDADNA